MSRWPDPLLSARFNNIQGTILSPVSQLDLTGYISHFGKLIFGPLKQEFFDYQFNVCKKQQIFWLLHSTFEDFAEKQPVQFYMHSLREAQRINRWTWPGLFNVADRFKWVKGSSRLFATAMTKQNPNIFLNFLGLQNHSVPVDTYLQDPILITDDNMLHQVLNVNAEDDPWIPHCEIILNHNVIDSKEILELANIKDPNDITDHNTAGQELLQSFLTWRQRYGQQPILHVYTNWPELIKNTHNVWDIKIVGGVDEIKRNIRFPAHLENQAKWLNDFNKPPDNIHTLTVVEPRHIDVAELLYWVNVEKTTFISSDWSFLLYRPDTEYTNTFIDLSYIDN